MQDDFLIAGTKDGFIFVLGKNLQIKNCLDLNKILSEYKLVSEHPSIRSIDYSNNSLLIGTFGS